MSSKFETALKNTLNDEIAISENGSVGFKTSGKKLLDLNFAVSSLRTANETEIISKFSAAFYENPKLAIKWLFFARDIRGGMGERNLFRVCFKWLSTVRPELVKKLIPLYAEYGRFDDLFCLITFKEDDQVQAEVIKYIDEQWAKDVENMNNKKPISLLAKWMKSCNTSSPESVKIGKFLAKELQLSEKQYRKTLSAMRKYLNVTEVKTSANMWGDINYDTVSSQANLKYKNAFLKHDEARRREWLGKLENGEAKINSATLTVGEIVSRYERESQYDQTLESLWKALPTTFNSTRKVIAVVDGSGSMGCSASKNISCHDVANGLGIYFAERLDGPFKDKFITFSSSPAYVDISYCKSLREKIMETNRHCECSSTNVELTLQLVLRTAVENNLKQEDIPDLLILSDMQFDEGTSWSSRIYSWDASYSAKRNALFESIKKQFNNAGYRLPKISFWNISGRENCNAPIPIQENDLGVTLISGFSQNILKMVMSNKTDPFDALLETLNSKRYDAVENAIAECLQS